MKKYTSIFSINYINDISLRVKIETKKKHVIKKTLGMELKLELNVRDKKCIFPIKINYRYLLFVFVGFQIKF